MDIPKVGQGKTWHTRKFDKQTLMNLMHSPKHVGYNKFNWESFNKLLTINYFVMQIPQSFYHQTFLLALL